MVALLLRCHPAEIDTHSAELGKWCKLLEDGFLLSQTGLALQHAIHLCSVLCTFCSMLCTCAACCALLCRSVMSHSMLCYAMLCYAMLCYAMLCYAMLCYAMLYHVMLCCAAVTQVQRYNLQRQKCNEVLMSIQLDLLHRA